MPKNFKKSYKFAFKSSLLITLLLTLITSVFLYMTSELNVLFISIFTIVSFLGAFFIIQYRVEKFIYKRVKKIYDDLTLFYTGGGSQNPPYHFSGRNSQTVKASYMKLSEFFRLPIPLDLRYFRAKSDVWGVHRRLRETGGSRRKYLKTWFLDQNTP